MSHITESELAALQESNLGRSTPFSISGVSHGQLSVASAVERIVGPLPGLIDAAAKRAQCGRDEVEWYSWPEAFGTTAGPGGGAGGNMITTFQVFAFDAAGERTKWCAGRWKHWNGEMGQKW